VRFSEEIKFAIRELLNMNGEYAKPEHGELFLSLLGGQHTVSAKKNEKLMGKILQ